MNRRGVLGAILGAPAAANAAYINQAPPFINQAPLAPTGLIPGGFAESFPAAPSAGDTVKFLRERLSGIGKNRDQRIRDAMFGGYFGAIDPDIEAMRSLSGWAKRRMMAERYVDRADNAERTGLLAQIESYLKRA